MHLARLVAVVALIGCASGTLFAGALLTGEEAPEWRIAEWINGDPGSVKLQEGRVLVLHFFQMWCPGCNEFSMPVMQRWEKLYGDRGDFMIVSIHSVFEGHEYQTTERLRKYLRRHDIWHPVGIDAYAHSDDLVPVTMQRYEAIGTPQVAIIDKTGLLVFNHFGEFHIPTVEFLLDRLLKEESKKVPPAKPAVGRNAKLSGTYKVRIEQTSNTCGPPSDPVSINVKLDVITDFIEVRSPRALLGRSELKANYNSRTLKINFMESVESQLEGSPVESSLTILGQYVQGSLPAEITYNALLRRQSDRADLICLVRVQGTATRIGD